MIKISNIDSIGVEFLIFEIELDDLPSDTTIKNPNNYYSNNINAKNNFDYDKMNTSEFNSLRESFKDENLFNLISEIYENSPHMFGLIWKYPNKHKNFKEFLEKNIRVISSISMDSPGFELPKHFDNRKVFGNFILNLVDNPNSTKFYDYRKNDKLIYEAPKEKGKGVFFVNYENTFHSYKNDSTINRYVHISSLNLILNEN